MVRRIQSPRIRKPCSPSPNRGPDERVERLRHSRAFREQRERQRGLLNQLPEVLPIPIGNSVGSYSSVLPSSLRQDARGAAQTSPSLLPAAEIVYELGLQAPRSLDQEGFSNATVDAPGSGAWGEQVDTIAHGLNSFGTEADHEIERSPIYVRPDSNSGDQGITVQNMDSSSRPGFGQENIPPSQPVIPAPRTPEVGRGLVQPLNGYEDGISPIQLASPHLSPTAPRQPLGELFMYPTSEGYRRVMQESDGEEDQVDGVTVRASGRGPQWSPIIRQQLSNQVPLEAHKRKRGHEEVTDDEVSREETISKPASKRGKLTLGNDKQQVETPLDVLLDDDENIHIQPSDRLPRTLFPSIPHGVRDGVGSGSSPFFHGSVNSGAQDPQGHIGRAVPTHSSAPDNEDDNEISIKLLDRWDEANRKMSEKIARLEEIVQNAKTSKSSRLRHREAIKRKKAEFAALGQQLWEETQGLEPIAQETLRIEKTKDQKAQQENADASRRLDELRTLRVRLNEQANDLESMVEDGDDDDEAEEGQR